MNQEPSLTTTQAPDPEMLSAWQHLANLQLSQRLILALLQRYRCDPRAIFAASDADLEQVPELHARHLLRLRDTTLDTTPRQRAWLQ